MVASSGIIPTGSKNDAPKRFKFKLLNDRAMLPGDHAALEELNPGPSLHALLPKGPQLIACG